MKEFDFDELDRAVSSALGGQSPRPASVDPVSPANARTAPVVAEVVREREAPEFSVPERPVEEAPAPRTVAPSRPRTGGRFMDVVHPSTDMRQTGPLTGVRLPTEVPAPVEEPAAPAVAPRQEVSMEDIRAVPRSKFEYPPQSQEVIEPEEPKDDWSSAPDSPFLADAKVEKRPLGASEPTGFGSPLELPELEALPVFEEIPVPTTEPEVVVAEPDVYTEMDAESVPEFDIDEVEASVATEATLETPPVEVPTVEDAPESEYAGPVAITPQYTAKPSANQESGEIFDTESYHQPFAAPVKKKSGALKIVLISLLVLILGAGVGAVVYVYVLPMV